MKHLIVSLALVGFLVPLLSSAGSDEEAITALVKEWESAYNNHDAQQVLACWDENGVIASGARKTPLPKPKYAEYLPARFDLLPKLEVKRIQDVRVASDRAEATILLTNYPSPKANWRGRTEFQLTFSLLKGQDGRWRFVAWDY
ncbi:MAG: SgcJ/EcaC family oxidoreductase [Actinomycetota bacterium]|nr:SgcJ/EcaC family oxidoreductase [Actinomycetota bacterium]